MAQLGFPIKPSCAIKKKNLSACQEVITAIVIDWYYYSWTKSELFWWEELLTEPIISVQQIPPLGHDQSVLNWIRVQTSMIPVIWKQVNTLVNTTTVLDYQQSQL